MSSLTLQVPEEGLKLLCIAGKTSEGNPVWKEVGKISATKNGKAVVLLDCTFNPAGVHKEDRDSANALLTVVPYSQEELQRRRDWNKEHKEHYQSKKQGGYRTASPDWEDDIPF